MRMMYRLGLCCLSLLLIVPSVKAADGPELIPSSSAAVIKLMAPQKTLKQASSFIDSVQQGYGSMVLGQAGMLGVAISNPTMQGVDQSRDWWAAVFVQEDEDPAVVFVIPATDTDAMSEALDKSYSFVAHDDYGIYSDDEDAIETIKKHLESRTSESAAAVASEEVVGMFENSHIAIGVNLVVLKETYKDRLDEMREEMMEGLSEAQGEMLEVPGVNLEFLTDLLGKAADKLVVAVEDSEGYCLSVTLAADGFELEEYLQFAEGSRAAKFLKAHPASEPKTLKKLPADQLAYWSINGDLTGLNAWGMGLLPQMLEMDDEEKAKWEGLSKDIKAVKFQDSSASFSLGNLESGLLRTVVTGSASPSDKFRAFLAKTAELMDGLDISGVKQEMSLEKSHEEIEGVDVDLLTTRQIVDDNQQFGGLQAQMNQFLYGGDTIETRIAYLEDGTYIQTMGGETEAMENAIEAYKAGAAGDDEVLTRDLAPLGKANFVALIDLQSMIKQALEIAADAPNLPPMPFDQESLKDLEVQRSYIGMSVSTTDRGCSGQLRIPIETFQAGASMAAFFQRIQGGNAF
ncbi:hypothetical protein [Rubinisphaera margarita]|uniref:hypothetical protein n=1 Tax=Rubinisphaera margarita TaxID=2909586 RepID=UPI001EE7D606|nr:hypothetical protein [Rubinisphaera margarita]MCG6157957.1 hypothetical protein [Rubinisphaera margarita]